VNKPDKGRMFLFLHSPKDLLLFETTNDQRPGVLEITGGLNKMYLFVRTFLSPAFE
jgi:hypothetical protein